MDAAAADAEEAAAAAHHEAAQRQAAAGAAGGDAGGASPDSGAAEDGQEPDHAEADMVEEGAPSGTSKECMECGEEKVGSKGMITLLCHVERHQQRDCTPTSTACHVILQHVGANRWARL